MKNYYVKKGSPCTLNSVSTIKKRLIYILNNLQTNKGEIILDIGTGFGIYLSNLSPKSKLGIGIDIDKKNLIKAKEKKSGNTEMGLMSSEYLAFKSNALNSVIMIEVLEHLDDYKKSISEISRILKPGGKLIITAPNKLFPFETHGVRFGTKEIGTKGFGFPLVPYFPEKIRRKITNARVFTPWHVKKILMENGFRIADVKLLSPNFDWPQVCPVRRNH